MNDKWTQYHATRLNLIQSIDSHLRSIEETNVYNNGSRSDIPLNTSGDHALTNESMGHDLLITLREKLTIDSDREEDYPRPMRRGLNSTEGFRR